MKIKKVGRKAVKTRTKKIKTRIRIKASEVRKMSKKEDLIDVIILAGGTFGKKKPFPKALLEIDGKTIIKRQMEWLDGHVKNFIISCTDSDAFKIKRYLGPLKNVIYATTATLPGTAGALKRAMKQATTDKVLVVNVDDLTNIDLRSLISFGANTVCVANPRLPYGVIEIHGQEVISFREKPLLRGVWVNCGVYLLRKDIEKDLPILGNIAMDVFPFMKLKAYRHFGVWIALEESPYYK